MANNILAVHLGADSIALAVAQSTLRTLRVQLLAVLEPASPALADLVRGRQWDRIVASVPADAAAFRMLDFPFRDRRRLGQAVGPALEAHVPLSLDEAEVAWDFTGSDHRGPVLAAMFPNEALAGHRQALAALGIEPDRFVWEPSATLAVYRRAAAEPTFTAIDLGADSATVACFAGGRLRGLRVTARADDATTVRNVGWFVRTLDPETSRCYVGGLRADVLLPELRAAAPSLDLQTLPERCPVDIAPSAAPVYRSSTSVLGLVLAAGADAEPPVLELASERAARSDTGEVREAVRTLAPWAGAAAALLLTAGAFDAARWYRREQRLEAAASRIYGSVMSDGRAGPGSRVKMEARVAELQRRLGEAAGVGPSATPLGVLADMSAAVPVDLHVEFDLYTYDPPTIRLRGRSESFESVTRLQDILRASGRFTGVEVSDVRASVNNGVEFELTLKVGDGDQPA